MTKAVEVSENPAVASPLLQQEGEDLEAFLVRIAVAELIYSPSEASAIIHSVLEDETDLGFGVSTHQDNAKACWVHHSDATLPCANDVFEQVFSSQPDTPAMLKIFFAVAYQRGEELLVVYDRHDRRNSVDSVDGFRVVVVLENGWWREQSLQAVY